MPWKSASAKKHTKKATTPRLKTAWRKAANAALKHYGDEAAAVRVANSAVNKMSGGTGRGPITARRKSVAAKRKRGPGRTAGFHHSAATRRKMRAAHASRKRKTKRTALKSRVGRMVKGFRRRDAKHKITVAHRRNKHPGRPRRVGRPRKRA
jgi:hypothetical protein